MCEINDIGRKRQGKKDRENVGESRPDKFYSERDIISSLLASFNTGASPAAEGWNQSPEDLSCHLKTVRLRMLDRYLCSTGPLGSCFLHHWSPG